MCFDAAERVGQRVCVHELHELAVWDSLSIGTSARAGWRKIGKYLAPAIPEAPLPVVFNDATRYRLHYCMLKQGFQPLFPALPTRTTTPSSTTATAARCSPATSSSSRRRPPGALRLHRRDPRRRRRAHQRARGLQHLPPAPGPLPPRRRRLHPEHRRPGGRRHGLEGPARQAVVLGGEESVTYEAYASGVRLRTRAPLHQRTGQHRHRQLRLAGHPRARVGAQRPASASWPASSPARARTCSATSTSSPPSAAPPTPSSPTRSPPSPRTTASWCASASARSSTRSSRPPSPRPRPSGPSTARASRSTTCPTPPTSSSRSVDDIPTATARIAASRSAASAARSRAWPRSPDPRPAYQTPGMGIPPRTISSSCSHNSWELVLAGKKQKLSFADTITMPGSPTRRFAPTPACARPGSPALSAAMVQRGKVDPGPARRAHARRSATCSATPTPWSACAPPRTPRTRSTSTAPASTPRSAPAAATPTAAAAATRPATRASRAAPLDEGLKIVWASLWDFGAFEEREYYQIDHSDIAMGVLVSTQYEDEQANGVAFTGNPTVKDDPATRSTSSSARSTSSTPRPARSPSSTTSP
jgi:hypothetical protein